MQKGFDLAPLKVEGTPVPHSRTVFKRPSKLVRFRRWWMERPFFKPKMESGW